MRSRVAAARPALAALVLLVAGVLVARAGAMLLEQAAPLGLPARLLACAVLAVVVAQAGRLVEAAGVPLARWSWLLVLPLVAAFVVTKGASPVAADAVALASAAFVAAALVGISRDPQVAATAWSILGAMAAVVQALGHTDTGAFVRLDVPRSAVSVGLEASHALDVAIVTNWFTLVWLATGAILWRAYRFPPRARSWRRELVLLLVPVAWAVLAVTMHPAVATVAVTGAVIGRWWPLLAVSGVVPAAAAQIER